MLAGTVDCDAFAQQPVPRVTAMTAQAQDYVVTTRLPGRIRASSLAEVRPQVSGIIRQRLFEEGAPVEEGQPLYKIDDESYEAAVAAASAAVAQAKANFDQADLAARRASDLFASRAGSAAARDSAVASRDGEAAALQAAEAQLSTARIDLERTLIRAPISGVIGLSQTTAGALVGAQQTNPLATIRSLDPVNVDVTQSVNDLMRWRSRPRDDDEDATATLILPNDQPFPIKGELRAAEPQVEPTTGMVTLRVSFANPDRTLLPGLYVEVELPQARAENAVLVPHSAVMRNAAGVASSWIVEDGKIAVRDIEILTTSGNSWVVTDGLKSGDVIVTSGFQKAAPGGAVEVELADSVPTSANSGDGR